MNGSPPDDGNPYASPPLDERRPPPLSWSAEDVEAIRRLRSIVVRHRWWVVGVWVFWLIGIVAVAIIDARTGFLSIPPMASGPVPNRMGMFNAFALVLALPAIGFSVYSLYYIAHLCRVFRLSVVGFLGVLAFAMCPIWNLIVVAALDGYAQRILKQYEVENPHPPNNFAAKIP